MATNRTFNKFILGIAVTMIVLLAGLKAYGYYLDRKLENIQADIDALSTSVDVFCGWEGGEVRVSVLVPTKAIDAMDGEQLDELNDMICDEAQEAINEALGNE